MGGISITSNINRLKTEIDDLIKEGQEIITSLTTNSYNNWYSKSLRVVKTLIKERFDDFKECYKSNSSQRSKDESDYTINDHLTGWVPTYFTKERLLPTVKVRIETQIGILRAARELLDSSLRDINKLLQVDLFEDILDAAEVLLDNGFIRCGGSLVCVVLENHLKTVYEKNIGKMSQRNPSIDFLSTELYEADVIDMIQKREIDWCGGIRYQCDISSSENPTESNIRKMISDVKSLIMTVL